MVNKNKNDASASMAGYLYQGRLALLLGLRASKSKVNQHITIEKFDDIAFEDDTNIVESLIQAKHHVNPGNLSNASTDLWKTIKIWAEKTAQDPKFPLETKLIIITTEAAVEESIAYMLKESDRDESRALSELNKVANESSNKDTKSARDTFLKLPEENRKALVSSIMIYDSSASLTDVASEIESELYFSVPEQHVPTLVNSLEGWWWSVVAKFLIGERQASISVIEIRKKIDELAEMFKRDNLPLFSMEGLVTPTVEKLQDATYVRQMRLVNAPDRSISRGIQDYYKSKTQRSRWARENLLLDGENEEYDQKLIDKWERYSDSMLVKAEPTLPNEKIKCGQDVFFWATATAEPFRNRNELWLSAGSFQALADNKKVGWHPDYLDLLSTPDDLSGEDNE